MGRLLFARIVGRLGFWLVDLADRLDTKWDPVPPKLLAIYEGELDKQLNYRDMPTLPPAPLLPEFEPSTGVRQCLPPKPPPKGERRVIVVGNERASVTPPPGSFWQKGGAS